MAKQYERTGVAPLRKVEECENMAQRSREEAIGRAYLDLAPVADNGRARAIGGLAARTYRRFRTASASRNALLLVAMIFLVAGVHRFQLQDRA
jgi:hypothetical protein